MSLLPILIAQKAEFGSGGFEAPSDAFSGSDAKGDAAVFNLETIISNVIGVLTIVAGLYFIINFVLAGISWVGAGGDSGKIQKARDNIINSVVGMLVIVAAYALIGLIGSLLGIDILNAGELIQQLAPTP